MKNLKLFASVILLFATVTIQAQSTSKKGATSKYVMCYDETTHKWTKIDAELFKIKKEGKLKGLQYKLRALNYDVAITNVIDDKTIHAFEAEKLRLKNLKKTKRKLARLKRKKK